MNKLLYGYGTTERIVAAEPVYGKENFVRRYIRNEDDEIEQDFVEISYYLHTKADDPALSDTYSDINKIPALGTLHYDTIVETKHFPTFKWLEKNANHAYSAPKQSQYFIQTGDTLFKGMTFDGPLRLYVDIEVHTAKGFEFPNSSRREDEIIIIALCDNRGREWTLVNKGDEVQLLNDFLKLFREIDPDIMCLPETEKILLSDGRNVSVKSVVEDGNIARVSNVKHGRVQDVSTVDSITMKTSRFVENVDLIELSTKYGIKVRSTTEHPHYAYKASKGVVDYYDAKELNVGDYLCRPVNVKSDKRISEYSQDDFYFAGLMITDGHVDKQQSYFSNTDNDLLEWVKQYLTLRDIGWGVSEQKPERHHKTLERVYFSYLTLKDMFLSLGLNTGNKSAKDASFDLSNIFCEVSSEKVLSFLAGLIDGDGHWTKNHVCITINSDSLKEWVVSICMKIGLLAHKIETGIKIIPTSNKHKVLSSLSSKCKAIKTRRETYEYNSDIVPSSVVDLVKPFFNSGKSAKDFYSTKDGNTYYYGLKYSDVNLPKTTTNYILNKRTTLTRKNAYKLIESVEDKLTLFSDRKKKLWELNKRKIDNLLSYYWFPIKSVERKNFTGNVYNFETTTHNYMVNNLLTHNCNHNQFRFDLPYLQDRFNLHNIEFALGRNGTEPYTYPTNIKFGGRTMEYTNFSIEGRHVIDTYFLVKQADVFKRDMPGHGLKDVVKYLGKASDDRVYIPGDRIASVWRGEDPEFTREQLIHYALDDVREARILDLAYGQSVFYSTQYVPLPLQDVARYGTGTMIELLFYREYLRNRYSWPKPNPERDFGGGFFHLYEYGIINEPLVYVDVSSLYPYLGDSLNTKPANDELDVYRRLLGGMKSERLADKATANRLKAEGKLEEAEPIDNKQNSTKIYINTGYYGYLTWSMASLNDYDNGEKITSTGQASLKKMIEIIDEMGGRTIRAATDGLLVVPPPEYQGSVEKENEMIAVVQDKLNAWFGPTYNVDTDKNPMILDHDGRYEGMISFDTLSCVLRKPGGKYSIKGNTLKNRALEQFGREFLMKSFDYLFDEDYEGLKKMYEEYLVLTENSMLSAEAVSKTSSINKTLKEYQDSVDSGKSNRAAAYELALASSRKYEKGDSITYYVKDMGYEDVEVRGKMKRRKVKAKAFESAEPIENYNYDYDVDYYVKRLETALRKLLPVLGVERHKELFPKVKLYKKDLDKLADHE